MESPSVGVRELQQNAAEVVRRAATGEVVQITVRGRSVAMLTPAREVGLDALVSAGLARRATVEPRDLGPPPAPPRGSTRTLVALLDEARDAER